MKIKELAQISGLPKTTIHYYSREGLLPAPQKSAANSARYDETHVRRLALIQQLRSVTGPALSVFHVRRVLELVESGVPLEQAVALQLAVTHSGAQGPATRSMAALNAESGLSRRAATEAKKQGLLKMLPHESCFDDADVQAAVHIKALLAAGIQLDELARIAALIRDISAYEASLAARLANKRSPVQRAALFQTLQTAGNGWHAYLFLRARQHEIANGAITPASGGVSR